MSRWSVILAFGTVAALHAPLHADEPPQVEFVRGLRTQYGPRLAAEYLARLEQQHLLDADPRLLLELARTRLELATGESNLAERLRLTRDAEAKVEQLLRSARNPEVAADAKVIKLQIASLHGKALLSHALRQESPEARQAEAMRARAVLAQAAEQLQAALRQFDADLARLPAEPKLPAERQARKAVADARLRAQLDLAINTFDQVQTFVDTGSRNLDLLQQRSEVLSQAQKLFEIIAGHEPRVPLCWEARAWVGRCIQERDAPLEARRRFEELARETSPAADSGKRLAGYFRLLRLLQVMQGRAPADPGERPETESQRLAETWRRLYPGHVNSPEGYGVRFILAEACLKEANAATEPAPRKKELLEKARELFREVELADHEFSERARRRKIDCIVALLDKPEAMEKVDVASLRTFDELYVRAQFEAARLGEETETDARKRADLQKARLGRIAQALRLALAVVEKNPGKVPEEERDGARLMLAYASLSAGDAKQAIQLGEELARRDPPSSQSPNAAIYALQAYQQLLAKPDAAGGPAADVGAYRTRMLELARYTIQAWPDELAADVGRHQLAILYMQDRKYPEAVELLSDVRPSYPGAILARYQLALVAFQIGERDKPTATDKDTRPWRERGLAALENLPPISDNASPATARAYVLAKLKLGEALYGGKKFAELEALARRLNSDLENSRIRLAEADAKNLVPGVRSLQLYAGYGQADADYQAGRRQEALKVLDATLALCKGEKKDYLEVLIKTADLRRELLDFALRANLESQRPVEAVAVVQLLRSVDPGGDTAAVLEPVLSKSIAQLAELRARGRKEALERAAAGLDVFLDALAAQLKDAGPELPRLAATGFAALEKHERASKLLRELTPPRDSADPGAVKSYQLCRTLLVRELRLASQLGEAESLLKELQKEPWAADRVELRIEELHLLDARGKHQEAYPAWNTLVTRLASGVSHEHGRDLYFESYYSLVESYYRYGQSQEEPKRATVTRKAAGFIADLETAWPELGGLASHARFRKLLEQEKPLKEEYDRRKSAR